MLDNPKDTNEGDKDFVENDDLVAVIAKGIPSVLLDFTVTVMEGLLEVILDSVNFDDVTSLVCTVVFTKSEDGTVTEVGVDVIPLLLCDVVDLNNGSQNQHEVLGSVAAADMDEMVVDDVLGV